MPVRHLISRVAFSDFRRCWSWRSLVVLAVLCQYAANASAAGVAQYVIQISVDGLGSSYLQSLIDQGQAPNFKRLQDEGAWTHNARTDFDFTITLPNHT